MSVPCCLSFNHRAIFTAADSQTFQLTLDTIDICNFSKLPQLLLTTSNSTSAQSSFLKVVTLQQLQVANTVHKWFWVLTSAGALAEQRWLTIYW